MRAAAQRITYVWLGTSVLTAASWIVASLWRGSHPSASAPETLVVLALAAVKARLIFREFMEVRGAPIWLQRFTDGWLGVLWVAIVIAYAA